MSISKSLPKNNLDSQPSLQPAASGVGVEGLRSRCPCAPRAQGRRAGDPPNDSRTNNGRGNGLVAPPVLASGIAGESARRAAGPGGHCGACLRAPRPMPLHFPATNRRIWDPQVRRLVVACAQRSCRFHEKKRNVCCTHNAHQCGDGLRRRVTSRLCRRTLAATGHRDYRLLSSNCKL